MSLEKTPNTTASVSELSGDEKDQKILELTLRIKRLENAAVLGMDAKTLAYMEKLEAQVRTLTRCVVALTNLSPQGHLDPLVELVAQFSAALLAKLRSAEVKYRFSNGWLRKDWAPSLRHKLQEHIEKGDPLDVAAYCAFAFWHGWSLKENDEPRPNAPTDDYSVLA